jgi:predicted dehydrogenase
MSARIGIVGLGTMGMHHADRLVATDAEIVAGADVVADARATFADRFDGVTYEDHAAMYETDLDGVIITVPNAFHENVAVTALDEGVHTLVEKPLAHTVESAERIAEAASDADSFCTVGFVMHYYNAVCELLALRDQGEFGEITHVEARYVRRHNRPTRGWFIDADLAGGGALVDIGVHVLDLALTILDFPDIDGVYGRTRTAAGYDVEDSASAFIRCGDSVTTGCGDSATTGCGDSATINVEAAWVSNGPAAREIVVRGTDGGATLDIDTQELRIYPGPDGDPQTVETETEDWLAPEDEAFAAAVAEGTPPGIGSVEQALTVQRVLAAIYRSETCGESIRL